MMRFNAWSLARSWASVALAQGSDDSRPALYRTTMIEMFTDEGIRLISTDSYLLLKAWIPCDDADDEPAEPGIDVLPDEVAICSDRDHRVLGLMKYVQTLTKADGADTMVTVDMGIGELADGGRQSSLEGLTQSSVYFHMSEQYDERIESPVFEGAFPNWRPLWDGHVLSPTTLVGFGANGILRLGKLSALWDKSTIEFDLGGSVGVAKLTIQAPDVNVTGLVMPVDLSRPVPPSPDGEVHELSEALDDWIADVLRTEVKNPEGDEFVQQAASVQVRRCIEHAVTTGYASRLLLTSTFGMSDDRADEILSEMEANGWVGPVGDDGKHVVTIAADDLDDAIGERYDDDGDDEPL